MLEFWSLTKTNLSTIPCCGASKTSFKISNRILVSNLTDTGSLLYCVISIQFQYLYKYRYQYAIYIYIGI